MTSQFAALGVDPRIVSNLDARGISECFPIQALTIPPALAGRDVCGKAPTGSGKTIAFGVPIAQRVTRARPGRPRALVLAPTRELATQIHDELKLLLAPSPTSVATFFGGVGFGNQLKALRRGVDIAVACPGRLQDLVDRGDIALDDVEIVVLDEADRMADMGFLPVVKRLLDQVRTDRQTLLFSATLDGDVDVLIRRYQHDPVVGEVEPANDHPDRTTHHFVEVARGDRVALAARTIREHGSTVVFCRTKHGADRVARQLDKAGVEAVSIHGGRSQGQRERALAAFSGGRALALVATDVAARGIHIDDVGCVIHFDVPGDHKDYIHRSGRTGRAGAEGVVYTFVTDDDADAVRQLRRDLDRPDEATGSRSPSRAGGNRSGTTKVADAAPGSRSGRGRGRSRRGSGRGGHQGSGDGAPARAGAGAKGTGRGNTPTKVGRDGNAIASSGSGRRGQGSGRGAGRPGSGGGQGRSGSSRSGGGQSRSRRSR